MPEKCTWVNGNVDMNQKQKEKVETEFTVSSNRGTNLINLISVITVIS